MFSRFQIEPVKMLRPLNALIKAGSVQHWIENTLLLWRRILLQLFVNLAEQEFQFLPFRDGTLKRCGEDPVLSVHICLQ